RHLPGAPVAPAGAGPGADRAATAGGRPAGGSHTRPVRPAARQRHCRGVGHAGAADPRHGCEARAAAMSKHLEQLREQWAADLARIEDGYADELESGADPVALGRMEGMIVAYQ